MSTVTTSLPTMRLGLAARIPDWLSVVGLTLLLVAAWGTVYLAGGTRTALPHLFYIPIVLAVLPFGLWGGVVTAVAATLLCGPLMPLDTSLGDPQPVTNWLIRGGFFVAVGAATGTVVRTLRQTYELAVAERLRYDLERGGATGDDADPTITVRIQNVLSSRDFHPVYQPIYALDDGRLLAVEALTRFEAEPYQPPNIWFDQATEVGLAADLELAAIEAALVIGTDQLATDIAISVNSSPQTLADPRLLDLLDQHHDRPLIVEVTEHAVVDDYRLLESVREQLRERGIKLAVDDAGAGFASLRHIVRLAPEIIKLDPTLIRDIRIDPIRQALARSLIQFAHQTRTQLIAEGIEHSADLYACRDLGVHAAQGYLFGHPGPLPVPHIFGLLEGP